ncbi:MAG: hypothetical protein AYK18_15340 [Theionarchaea archaeon DG-70]|nr:MAG: hypothetical protein AYK18_15340 [Theionarchaea archaeon DG-70]
MLITTINVSIYKLFGHDAEQRLSNYGENKISFSYNASKNRNRNKKKNGIVMKIALFQKLYEMLNYVHTGRW